MTIWKIDISTFTRLTATKPGRDKGLQGQGAARKGFSRPRLLVLIISLQIIIFVVWMKLINKETENHDEDGGSDEVEYYWIIILSTLKFSNWKNCREPQNMMAISDQGFPQKKKIRISKDEVKVSFVQNFVKFQTRISYWWISQKHTKHFFFQLIKLSPGS